MFTYEEISVISGLSVLGAGILTWCLKMQWDQHTLGKTIKQWMGKAGELEAKNIEIDKKVAVMEREYDFMCGLVLEDVKMRRGDLWEHHSPLKPTPHAVALIPEDIMATLRSYNGGTGEKGNQCLLKALYISDKLSVERLAEAARDKGMTVLELIALVTDMDGNHE